MPARWRKLWRRSASGRITRVSRRALCSFSSFEIHLKTFLELFSVSLVVQIYLSISRADLAKKELARALSWAEDDLLLQSIEATLGLVTGTDAYKDSNAFFTEQLGNPSLASTHLLAARGIARLLRGEVSAAHSDLEEVLNGEKGGEGEEEALCASVVAAGLGAGKKGEADELFRLDILFLFLS